MNKSLCFSILFFVACPWAKAEYRAFLIQIKQKSGELKQTFTSTLDPEQYKGFFPLGPDEKISYVDTWMCRGRTGDYRNICDNPRAPAALPSPPAKP